jgi:TRAP-type C4-dicarboxylate transport system permease small subunit
MEKLVRGAHALMAAIRVVTGVLLIGSVGVNFANIIGRYFLSVSIPWAEEVMLFMIIGCVFLNAGLVGWSGRQIRMDAVISLLPPRLRSLLEIAGEIVLIATSILLAFLAWPVVSMLAELDQRSQAADIPLVLPQAMMPLGFLIMAVLITIRMLAPGPGGKKMAVNADDR